MLVPVFDSNAMNTFNSIRETQQLKHNDLQKSVRAKSLDPCFPDPTLSATKKRKVSVKRKTSPRLYKPTDILSASLPSDCTTKILREQQQTNKNSSFNKTTSSSVSPMDSTSSSQNNSAFRDAFQSRKGYSEDPIDHATLLDDDLPEIPNLENISTKKSQIRRRSTAKTNFIQQPSKIKDSSPKRKESPINSNKIPPPTTTKNKTKWLFIYGNVGDCKVFLYSKKSKNVKDVTFNSRYNSLHVADCGGRLGPVCANGGPDMRNFCVSYCTVHVDDLVIVVSDGVHDNLDPQYLGISPKSLDIDVLDDDWENVDIDLSNQVKQTFREQKLLSVIHDTNLSPNSVCDALIRYSKDITAAGRQFMEDNPSLELPTDYCTYPGKMDHSSVVCVKVDAPNSDITKLLRNAFNKKESIYSPGHITRGDLERGAFN